MIEYGLVQAVFVPLLLAPVAYVLGNRVGPGAATWFTFAILLYGTILVVLGALSGQSEYYGWTEQFGGFGFALDGLSAPFAIMIYVLSTILVLYSRPYMMHRFEEMAGGSASVSAIRRQSGLYFALYLVFAMGMLGTVLSTNLIQFYVFFEVMLIPGFFLVSLWGDGPRRKIGLMFLFWTHVGAVVLLLGFLMIGLSVGSFDFVDIVEGEIPPDIVLLSAVAISIGLGVKLAVFMFHIWLPWVHGAAPTPISALLSPAMIGIGAYGIFRLVAEFLPSTFSDLAIWFHIWGLVTMLYGGAMALMQDDIKRLFAYSSISQMGYILFGIGSLSVLGMAGAEMMYVTHALGKGLLFMTAGILIVTGGDAQHIEAGRAGRKDAHHGRVCGDRGPHHNGGAAHQRLHGGVDPVLWGFGDGHIRGVYGAGRHLRAGAGGHRAHHVIHIVDAQTGVLRQDPHTPGEGAGGRVAHDRPDDGAGRFYDSTGDIPRHLP